MKHFFKVIEYEKIYDCHVCIDEDDKRHLIDLMVAGDFPEGTSPESLIGKTVSCSYTLPHISIAKGVHIVSN